MSIEQNETNNHPFNSDPQDGGEGYYKADPRNFEPFGEPELKGKDLDPTALSIKEALRGVLAGKAINTSLADKAISYDPSVYHIPDLPALPNFEHEPRKADKPQSPADERAQNPDGTYDF